MLDYISSLYTDKDILIDIDEFIESYKYTIANLINIELSFEKDSVALKQYRDKFLDLISSKWISNAIIGLFPNYLDYTNKYVNRRIKEKR